MHQPAHPGFVLREYLEPYSVSDTAKRLGVTRATLSRLLNGHTGLSANMAVRLAALLPQTRAEFWAGLQSQYDLWQERQTMRQHIEPLPMPELHPALEAAT